MSEQAATEFLMKNAADPPPIGGETTEERVAALVELGSIQGFDFTADECLTVLETARKYQAGELSEEQLEAVAGGVRPGEDLSWWEKAALWVEDLLRPEADFEEQDGTAVAGVRG